MLPAWNLLQPSHQQLLAAFDGFLNTPPFVVVLLDDLNILEQVLAEAVHSKPTLLDNASFHVLLSNPFEIDFSQT